MTSTKTALAVASAIQRFNPREMTGVGPSTFATLLVMAAQFWSVVVWVWS